jgi:hypothetical protein
MMKEYRAHFAGKIFHGYTKKFIRNLSTVWPRALKKFCQPYYRLFAVCA